MDAETSPVSILAEIMLPAVDFAALVLHGGEVRLPSLRECPAGSWVRLFAIDEGIPTRVAELEVARAIAASSPARGGGRLQSLARAVVVHRSQWRQEAPELPQPPTRKEVAADE